MSAENPRVWIEHFSNANKIQGVNFSITQVGTKIKPRFLCEFTFGSPPYNGYTAIGNSTNKKDAQMNSCKDMIAYLLRSNLTTPDKVPSNMGGSAGWSGGDQGGGKAEPQAYMYPPPPPPSQNYPSSSNPGSTSGYGSYGYENAQPAGIGQRQDLPGFYTSDQLAARNQANVQEHESLDMNAHIHGGWTLDNGKARLNMFLQQRKIQAEYKYSTFGPPHSTSFQAEMRIFVKEHNRWLHACEPGSNKALASKHCALSLVRQLFHLGLIEACGAVDPNKSAKNALTSIPVSIPGDILSKVHSCLSHFQIKTAEPGSASLMAPPVYRADPEDPLLIDAIAAFKRGPATIPWAPPMANWNAWIGGNIDTGPLANLDMPAISEQISRIEDGKYTGNQGNTFSRIEQMEKIRGDLPIAQHHELILETIANNSVTLIRGETGSGKTTQVPQYILDSFITAGAGSHCAIIVTQPRRLSAISIAERVAEERAEHMANFVDTISFNSPSVPGAGGLGSNSVGYAVRFESQHPRPFGSILYCTVGILLRKLASGLRGISHVIVDEIHERDKDTDFLLILLRDLVMANPSLRLILMSATVDVNAFQEYFGRCPILELKGRTHPVDTYFLEDIIELTGYDHQFWIDQSQKGPFGTGKQKKKKSKQKMLEGDDDEEEEGDDDDGDEEDVEEEDDGLDNPSFRPMKPAQARQADPEGYGALPLTKPALGGSSLLNEDLVKTTHSTLVSNRGNHSYSARTIQSLSAMCERQIPLEVVMSLCDWIANSGRPGSILVFLPGWALIQLFMKRFANHPRFGDPAQFRVLALHSQIPKSDQVKIFQPVPEGCRKLILSTNIAETSVTIDDVVFVVDSCKVRVKTFTSSNNLTQFQTVWASRTNCQQRHGRAGRVRPGICFRLCTRARWDAMDEYQVAEILRSPLMDLVLSVKHLRLGRVAPFLAKAIESPPLDALIEAEYSLREIGALQRIPKSLMENENIAVAADDYYLTELGGILAKLPIEQPRIGKALILAATLGIGEAMAVIAAFASLGQEPYFIAAGQRNISGHYRNLSEGTNSDHFTFLKIYKLWLHEFNMGDEYREREWCEKWSYSFNTLRMVHEAKKQLVNILTNELGYDVNSTTGLNDDFSLISTCLVLGLSPNLCLSQRAPSKPGISRRIKLLTHGGNVALANKSSVILADRMNDEFFVFGEKLRTKMVTCKQITKISVPQTLAFGCRRLDFSNETEQVTMDSWVPLTDVSPQDVSALAAMRRAVDLFLERKLKNSSQEGEDQSTGTDDDTAIILDTFKTLTDFQAPPPRSPYNNKRAYPYDNDYPPPQRPRFERPPFQGGYRPPMRPRGFDPRSSGGYGYRPRGPPPRPYGGGYYGGGPHY